MRIISTSSIDILARYGVAAAAVILVTVVFVIQPVFLSTENIQNVLRQSSFLAIFALGQMLPILTRGLDLSQGGVIGISSVVFALAARDFGIAGGAFLTLTFGLLIGLANGLVVAYARVSPLVVTLGVGSSLLGFALILSNGHPIFEVPTGFSSWGWGDILGLPIPAVVAVLIFGVLAISLLYTVWGRYVYAVGSNPVAALLAGIPVQTVTISVYTMSAGITAVGALLLSSRINSGHPTADSDAALQAIAAAVIGGVSLFGGRGSPFGVLLGALFLGVLANALNLLNVSSYVQQVVAGCAIILAVALDRLRIAATEEKLARATVSEEGVEG